MDLSTPTGVASFFANVIEHLEKPDRWIKGYLSVDRQGSYVHPTSKKAVKWCITGSILLCRERVYPLNRETSYIELAGILRRALKTRLTLLEWNDQIGLPHSEMIAKLKHANNLIRQESIELFRKGSG